jgi:hypothetical protein
MNTKWIVLSLLLIVHVASARTKPKKKPAAQPAAPAAATAPVPAAATSPASSPREGAPNEAAPEAAGPTGEPAKTEAPAAPAQTSPQPGAAKPLAADLESLNAEYHALRDELFRTRAKAELLGTALFKTRLVTTFRYLAQRAWPLKKVSLKLDDQPVYAADAPSAEDPIKIYEGFLAPGRHSLAVCVECGAVGDSRLGYAAEDTFVFEAADGKQARVELNVDETGDGPQPLSKKKAGDFDVRVRARVRSLGLDEK